jgi:hypothetical protein
MASGVISSISFSVPNAGRVVLTCSFTVSTVNGDWNGNTTTQTFWAADGGAPTFGTAIETGATSNRQSMDLVFNVTAGTTIAAGIYGRVNGASAATWSKILVSYVMLKK